MHQRRFRPTGRSRKISLEAHRVISRQQDKNFPSVKELSFLILIPVLSLGIGALINATLVQGDYEWWGMARISYELFDRTGFWIIALGVWVAGVATASCRLTWRRLSEGRILFAWSATTGILICLVGVNASNLPVGSFFDLLALYTALICVPAVDLAQHSRVRFAFLSMLRSAVIAIAVFGAYTAIAYFHTMIKGSLFILAAPNDALLWHADTLLLGQAHYRSLAYWRASHQEIVRFLDVAYIALLQQICLSAIFFHGAKDSLNGRRYLLAMFLIYSIGPAIYFWAPSKGPMFYAPALFDDLLMLAPDTWWLAKLLTWSTDNTVAGIPHKIAPFSYIAALPSLHVGIALIMLLAMRRSRAITIGNAVLFTLTVVATNVLGWHYAVDVVVGFVLGALCWVLACWISPLQKEAVDGGRSRQVDGCLINCRSDSKSKLT